MTKNAAHKKAVRAHAAETGKPYLAAARDLIDRAEKMTAEPVPTHPALTIQRATESVRHEMPMPFHITKDGWVARQDWWRGEPLFAIGFTDEPKPGSVSVNWTEAWADPTLAVGKYPVMANKYGTWSVYTEPVETTRFTDAAFDTSHGSVTAEFGTEGNLVTVDIAPILRSLSQDEIEEIIETGEETDATHYWWSWVTDVLDLPREKWLNADDEDLFLIRINEDEYRAWSATRTGW
jgi:hypothetical protein